MPPEAAVHETTVAAIVKANEHAKAPARGAQADAVVVTNDNFPAYVDKQLGVEAPAPAEAGAPEAKAAEELKKIDADKKAKAQRAAEEAEEIDHPDKTKKERLNSRFSELTEKRKAAEAKAAAAEKTAAEAQARADAAEAERNALKSKYEPPKSDELGPEPLPQQFTDVGEYALAIKDWTQQKTLKEEAGRRAAEAAKAEGERVAATWKERVEATKAKMPDFEEKLAATPVKISDQARDAILRSDVGPEILYHLAENPDVAAGLGKLTVGEMLYSLGKIAATLGGSVKAGAKAGNGAAQQKTGARAEISEAPAPISPLNGTGNGVLRLNGGQEVPKNWTYEDYKRARQAGQIQ